jgi:hypothetical protein
MTAEATTTSIVRNRIAASVHAGRDLEEIEAKILAPAPVTEETKAALWLYAWLLQERRDCDRARRQNPDFRPPPPRTRATRPARLTAIAATEPREPARVLAGRR